MPEFGIGWRLKNYRQTETRVVWTEQGRHKILSIPAIRDADDWISSAGGSLHQGEGAGRVRWWPTGWIIGGVALLTKLKVGNKQSRMVIFHWLFLNTNFWKLLPEDKILPITRSMDSPLRRRVVEHVARVVSQSAEQSGCRCRRWIRRYESEQTLGGCEYGQAVVDSACDEPGQIEVLSKVAGLTNPRLVPLVQC